MKAVLANKPNPSKLRSTIIIATVSASMMLTTACGKKPTDASSDSVSSSEAVVESSINTVGSFLDDQSGANYAVYSSQKSVNIWESLLGSSAYAASCLRPYFSTCQNGVKSETYQDCQIGASNKTLSGTITLSYSHMSCTLATDGDTVTRTFDITVSGPRGGVLTKSSAVHADYKGDSYGGGGKITKTSAGYNLEFLGKNLALTKNNKSLFDISVRTLSPLQITGGLSRSQRRISNGSLEVNHNLAKFTSVITAQDLQWDNSCCHPISGSLSIAYSGSRTGTSSVQFNGCDTANLQEDGQTKQIEFSYCE